MTIQAFDWIPAGTPVVIVGHRGKSRWQPYTTKRDLQIQSTIRRTHKAVTFEEGDWKVLVHKKYIRPAHEFNGSQESLVGRDV